jgi:hypothetical protein
MSTVSAVRLVVSGASGAHVPVQLRFTSGLAPERAAAVARFLSHFSAWLLTAPAPGPVPAERAAPAPAGAVDPTPGAHLPS